MFYFVGEAPYHTNTAKEIEGHIRQLKCLEQPDCCPGAMYEQNTYFHKSIFIALSTGVI